MPTLYFCQPRATSQGVLHAVLTWEECKTVLTPDLAHYVGKQFPDVSIQVLDFALFHVAPAEAEGQWLAGYYRAETDIANLSAKIGALPKYEKCCV
jgi:hypothetical protein